MADPGGASDVPPPPKGPDSFLLTYNFTKGSHVGSWNLPYDVTDPLREILNPPLDNQCRIPQTKACGQNSRKIGGGWLRTGNGDLGAAKLCQNTLEGILECKFIRKYPSGYFGLEDFSACYTYLFWILPSPIARTRVLVSDLEKQ